MPVRGLPNITMHAKAKRPKRRVNKRPTEPPKPRNAKPETPEPPPWVRR